MNGSDRSRWDATAWASAFADGRAVPADLLESCLERIDRYDSRFGICNHVADRESLFDQAAASAARWREGAPLSPLDGVPFGVKANISVQGFPWHGGIAAFREVRAPGDADCVRQMRAAGMLPMALFNMHEAALGETTDNPAFRTTRNPHDDGRIAGGSSGGSAAAVAAGFAPVALGTDDLGSVRLPSALCGVVGFKPGRKRIPLGGVLPLCRRLDQVGVHCRSVADAAALTGLFDYERLARFRAGAEIESGPGIESCSGIESGPRNASGPGALPLARWNVTFEQPVSEAVVAACDGLLSAHGVDLCVDWSDVDLSAVRRAGLLICERDAAEQYARVLCDDPGGFSADFRRLVNWGAAQPGEKVRRAERLLADTTRRLLADLGEHQLLSPTTAHLTPRHGGRVPDTLADLTAPAAIAGVPAITVPLHTPSASLPVGVHVAGLEEADVLVAAWTLFPGVARRVP